MKILKEILLDIWQLPQNILGFLVMFYCTDLEKIHNENALYGYYFKTRFFCGVSLGRFIILDEKHNDVFTIKHESGHQKQSLLFGPLYLLCIGLPSITFNIYDQLFHKTWSVKKRLLWYYNLPWEKSANELVNNDMNEYVKNFEE